MQFVSTRDPKGLQPVMLAESLEAGLAPDGGLYVPVKLPPFDPAEFDGAETLPDIAERLLAPFFEGSALASSLAEICREALDIPVPLVPIDEASEMLELFHGPTAAFKDFGARFLASCLSRLPNDSDHLRTILVATSGDTGAAVAAAFHGKPGVRAVLLYPEGRVAERQAHGLECWGDNVRTLRVGGTFDDCQRLVKQALSDPALRGDLWLLSANSINLGRWLPQAAYYAYAALRALRRGKAPLRLIVPTGNLGNAMAALLLRKAGWPVAEVMFACNPNRVLPDFFASGVYRPQPAQATIANAMDVGAPSNFERLSWLYPDAAADPAMQARSFDDARIRSIIGAAPDRYGYIPCPHTACAFGGFASAGGSEVLDAVRHRPSGEIRNRRGAVDRPGACRSTVHRSYAGSAGARQATASRLCGVRCGSSKLSVKEANPAPFETGICERVGLEEPRFP
jgi:threonine synthase